MLKPRIILRASNFPSIRRSSSLPRQGPKAGFVKNIIGYESFTTFDAARASRRQHQLASMDDQGLRETRRRLVQSLHEIAFIFAKYGLRKPKVPLLPMVAPAPTVVPTVAAVDKDASASTSHKEIKLDEISKQQAHSLDNEKIDRGNEKNGIASAAVQEGLTSEALLWNALRRKDVKTTITLFNSAIGEGQSLSRRILARLFYAIVQSDCITAYQALLLYRNEGRLTNAEMKMYLRLCSSVSSLDPNNHNRRKATQFVRKLVADLHSMEWEEKQEILPKMIASLATQRMVKIGLHADGLYRYMAENEFQMTMGWLRQLLSLSKYNRQEDLPFHDILARLAEGEGHPHPLSVIQAIHNMFPFTNPSTVCPALKAVFQLQQTIESVDPNRIRNFQMLQLDLDCLEAISTGAAHSGSSEQISLVWEILEQCNYRPTETIYENTVIALAFSARDLEAAFGAINAMKQEGYIVSRALLRSFALALRSDKWTLDEGLNLLVSSEHLSLETLNAMMSSYAERGDVYDTLRILNIMQNHGIDADIRTYSFAVEVLGKNIHRWGKKDNPALVQENLDHADRVLGMMETSGIAPSRDLLRNYVELLCIADEIATANMVVDDLLSNAEKAPVCSKILYRVAMTNATIGDIRRARHLASFVSDDIPVLMKKIRSKEERFKRY